MEDYINITEYYNIICYSIFFSIFSFYFIYYILYVEFPRFGEHKYETNDFWR